MPVDGAGRQVQPVRQLGVGMPAHEQPQHLDLAGSESGRVLVGDPELSLRLNFFDLSLSY